MGGGQPHGNRDSSFCACSCTQCAHKHIAFYIIVSIDAHAHSYCVHEYAQSDLALLAYGCPPADKLSQKISLKMVH